MPPPSSGGLVIIQALKALEKILNGRNPKDLGRNSGAYLHMLAEVLKHGFADRAEYMGDLIFILYPFPNFYLNNVLIKSLLSLIIIELLPLKNTAPEYKLAQMEEPNHLNVIDAQECYRLNYYDQYRFW